MQSHHPETTSKVRSTPDALTAFVTEENASLSKSHSIIVEYPPAAASIKAVSSFYNQFTITKHRL